MDTTVYHEIPEHTINNSRLILFRQLYVCSGIWTFYFLHGLNLGAPTVFIPQLRREANSTSVVSDDTAASLSAVYGLAGFPWIYISAFLTLRYGKKITLFILSLITLLGTIVFLCSISVTQIFISEALMSLVGSSAATLFVAIVSEYCSPKYRGLFMTIKSASFVWGIWVANAIGTFFHWKNIALLGLACSIYTVLIIPFWPESPYWLASVGRFDECVASHRWLKGTDGEAEKELKRLLDRKADITSPQSNSLCNAEIITSIKSKKFYKPVLLSLLLVTQYYSSGKLVYAVFAIDVIKKITASESTAYTGMLILDGFSVFSTYIGCILSIYMRRRVLLILFSLITSLLLFAISIYLFLINKGLVVENSHVSIILLSAYSIAVCLGPMVLCSSLVGELLPLKSRILSICIYSTFERLEFTMFMKFGLYAIKKFGLCVIFFIFGIASILFAFLTFVYLPETKDRTLQEIEDCMEGVRLRSTTDDTNELSPLRSGQESK